MTMHVAVSYDLEKRFRDRIANIKGKRNGNLRIAVTEAFEMWIANNPEKD